MKTSKNIYGQIYSMKNLIFAWQKTRKGKMKKEYVLNFEKDLAYNLRLLNLELRYKKYSPHPLKTFILRDPKTGKISKSHFRDRLVHHAIVNILEPIFDRSFIYDNCASRKNKGTLFALNRFETFRRKTTCNFTSEGYCLKADIKHYFEEINHEILINLIKRKIGDENAIWLIGCVMRETDTGIKNKGMPLGNLTSQFFLQTFI